MVQSLKSHAASIPKNPSNMLKLHQTPPLPVAALPTRALALQRKNKLDTQSDKLCTAVGINTIHENQKITRYHLNHFLASSVPFCPNHMVFLSFCDELATTVVKVCVATQKGNCNSKQQCGIMKSQM